MWAQAFSFSSHISDHRHDIFEILLLWRKATTNNQPFLAWLNCKEASNITCLWLNKTELTTSCTSSRLQKLRVALSKNNQRLYAPVILVSLHESEWSCVRRKHVKNIDITHEYIHKPSSHICVKPDQLV